MTYEEIVSFVGKNLKKTAAKKVENHIAVEFDIYGEGEGAFFVEVKEGTINVQPYEYYDRDAKVFITADELVKIISGERTPEESYEDGILMVEGEVNAAKELIKLIKTPAKKAPAVKSVKKTSSEKKPVTKKTTAKKTVKAEKEIVKETKKSDSKIAKDIKK